MADWLELLELGSVTVMVQLKLPMLEGESTETVVEVKPPAAVEPDAGLIWHQDWLVEAVQLEAVPPVFSTFIVWPGGVGPMEVAVNVKLFGTNTRKDLEGEACEAEHVELVAPPLAPEHVQFTVAPAAGKLVLLVVPEEHCRSVP